MTGKALSGELSCMGTGLVDLEFIPLRRVATMKRAVFLFPEIISLSMHLNPIALRKAKIVYNFGLSECNRVKCTC